MPLDNARIGQTLGRVYDWLQGKLTEIEEATRDISRVLHNTRLGGASSTNAGEAEQPTGSASSAADPASLCLDAGNLEDRVGIVVGPLDTIDPQDLVEAAVGLLERVGVPVHDGGVSTIMRIVLEWRRYHWKTFGSWPAARGVPVPDIKDGQTDTTTVNNGTDTHITTDADLQAVVNLLETIGEPRTDDMVNAIMDLIGNKRMGRRHEAGGGLSKPSDNEITNLGDCW
jgi:hypothetical protein